MSRFKNQATIGFLSNFLMAVVGFLGNILLARLVPVEVYGMFYVVLGIVSIITTPLVGFNDGGKKRISEEKAEKEKIAGNSFLLTVLYSGIIGILLYIGSLIFNNWVFSNLPVFFLLVLSLSFFEVFEKLLIGQQKIGYAKAIDFGRTLVTFILQIGFILLFGSTTVNIIGGLAITTLLFVPIVYHSIGLSMKFPDTKTFMNIYSFGKWSLVSSLMGVIYKKMDTILFGIIFSSIFAGYYEVGLKLIMPALILTGILAESVLPEVSQRISQGKSTEKLIKMSLAYASLLSLPLLVGAIFVGKEIIILAYGEKYAPASAFLIWLAVYSVFRSRSNIIGNILSGFDRPELTFYATGFVVLINLTLAVVLAHYIGPMGIVYSTVIASAMKYLIFNYYLKKVFGQTDIMSYKLISYQVICCFVMAGIIYLIQPYVHTLLVVVIGGGTYFLLLSFLDKNAASYRRKVVKYINRKIDI